MIRKDFLTGDMIKASVLYRDDDRDLWDLKETGVSYMYHDKIRCPLEDPC